MIKALNHNIDPLKWIFGIQVGYGHDQKEFLHSRDGSQGLDHNQGRKKRALHHKWISKAHWP
jgi:hypothetical protein